MSKEIRLSASHMTGEEIEFINEALYLNETGISGNNINNLENELKSTVGVSNALLLNNGTSAIHMALMLLGVKTNDEVICPAFTPMSTINPIIYQGAKPIFIDCEEKSWNMSPLLLQCALRDRFDIGRRPKAIIVSHVYGNPANMKSILELAEEYSIPVIEDACTSFGSVYDGKLTGTFGALGAYSFAGNNVISAGSGGALVSESKALIDKARLLNTQYYNNTNPGLQYQAGYNYLMNNVCAGIGRAQMKVLNTRVKQRRENFNYYRESLAFISCIGFQGEYEDAISNRCATCIRIDPKLSQGVTAEDIRKALKLRNIESYSLYRPMHMQPMFRESTYFGNWASDLLYAQGLCLPSGSNLTREELDRVIDVVMGCFSASMDVTTIPMRQMGLGA